MVAVGGYLVKRFRTKEKQQLRYSSLIKDMLVDETTYAHGIGNKPQEESSPLDRDPG